MSACDATQVHICMMCSALGASMKGHLRAITCKQHTFCMMYCCRTWVECSNCNLSQHPEPWDTYSWWMLVL